jgi:uncharacterized protein (TIGR03086 family)
MSSGGPHRLPGMAQLDLHPAADRLARLLAAVPDDALSGPTPCDMPLHALVDHVGGFAQAFTAAAKKDLGELTATPPGPADDPQLEDGWRDRITADLAGLADAWAAPEAWDGMTQAGGVDLPGEVAGGVVLDELVVHAWDVARSTGQPFECDDAELQAIVAMVQQFRGDSTGEIPGLFGPVVPVPDGAPLLDRVVGLTGRDPGWSPSK